MRCKLQVFLHSFNPKFSWMISQDNEKKNSICTMEAKSKNNIFLFTIIVSLIQMKFIEATIKWQSRVEKNPRNREEVANRFNNKWNLKKIPKSGGL